MGSTVVPCRIPGSRFRGLEIGFRVLGLGLGFECWAGCSTRRAPEKSKSASDDVPSTRVVQAENQYSNPESNIIQSNTNLHRGKVLLLLRNFKLPRTYVGLFPLKKQTNPEHIPLLPTTPQAKYPSLRYFPEVA